MVPFQDEQVTGIPFRKSDFPGRIRIVLSGETKHAREEKENNSSLNMKDLSDQDVRLTLEAPSFSL